MARMLEIAEKISYFSLLSLHVSSCNHLSVYHLQLIDWLNWCI